MKARNNYMALKIFLVLIFLSMVSLAKSQEGALTVISNPQGAPAILKYSELRSILMGEKQRWRNGSKIVIALMKTNTATGKITSQKIYDMSADELNKFWLALVFQGKAPAPAFFNTAAEVVNFVSQNPGAIGVIDQLAHNNNLRTIIIDGKSRIL
jgi:ABC-type phosphate transport system substrate-binding protein